MDKVVAVPVVQVVLACAACSSTRLSTCPCLSGCSTLTRWSISLLAGRAAFKVPGVRRQTVLSHSCRALRKPSRSHSCRSREDGRCPCCGRSCVVPWWSRRVSHSCIVEKLVEILDSESASRQCGKLPCSALFLDSWSLCCRRWRRAASEGALVDEEFFVVEGCGSFFVRQTLQFRSW